MIRKALARRIAERLFNEPATPRGAGTVPTRRAGADFGRVLCCSSVKDHSGYSPSSRRAPSQNSQQRCYASLRLCALALARRNLQRYIKGRPATATYLWREWRTILDQNSVDRIIAVMTAKTHKATELRQASPFAGALSPEEIARTIQREKERARARY